MNHPDKYVASQGKTPSEGYGQPLLQYKITTEPDPLKLSGDATTPCVLKVSGEWDNHTLHLLCSYVTVCIPIGDSDTDLFLSAPPSPTSLGLSWKVVEYGVNSGNDLGLNDGKQYCYTKLSCIDGINYWGPFKLTFNGNVNSKSGTAVLKIIESSHTVMEDADTLRLSDNDVVKHPHGGPDVSPAPDGYRQVLLQYVVNTDPYPVEVAAGTTTATKIIVTGTGDRSMFFPCVQVCIPIGNEPDDLLASPPATLPVIKQFSSWQLDKTGTKTGTQLGFSTGSRQYYYVQISCIMNNNQYMGPFTLTITGLLNDTGGTATIKIKESSRTELYGQNTLGLKDVDITKNLVDGRPVFLDNFISYPYLSDSQQLPATQLEAGAGMSLAWNSNGTYFRLFAKGNATPVYEGIGTKINVPQGFQTNTTLMLEAVKHGEKQYAFLTLIIRNPSLTPDSMEVSGAVNNSNNLTVQGALQPTATLLVNGRLDLGNNTSFQDITVVNNSTGINGTATVGTLNASELRVMAGMVMSQGSTLSVRNGVHIDQMSTGSATASGNCSINDLTIRDSILGNNFRMAMIGKWRQVKRGASFGEQEVRANTDGFAIAIVGSEGSDAGTVSYGGIWYDGQYYWATGAGLGNPGSSASAPKYGYCCVPVRKESTWKYSGHTASTGNQPLITIYWVPLGGDSNRSSFELIGAEKPLADIPLPVGRTDQQELYADFLRTLAKAVQKDTAQANALAKKNNQALII